MAFAQYHKRLRTIVLRMLGPLRHPRPMTVAELHLELEKEQEAAVCLTSVNRGSPYGSLLTKVAT